MLKCIIPPPFPFVPPVYWNFLMITSIRKKHSFPFLVICLLCIKISPPAPSNLYVSFQQGLACSLWIWHIFDQYFENPTQWAQNLAGGNCYRTMWWIFLWGIWGKSFMCVWNKGLFKIYVGEPPGTWSDVDSALMSVCVCTAQRIARKFHLQLLLYSPFAKKWVQGFDRVK